MKYVPKLSKFAKPGLAVPPIVPWTRVPWSPPSRSRGRRGGYTLRSRLRPGYRTLKQRRRWRRKRARIRRKNSRKRTWSKRGLIKYVKAKLHVENKTKRYFDAAYSAYPDPWAGNTLFAGYVMNSDDVKTNALAEIGSDYTSGAAPLLQQITEGSSSENRVGQEIYVKKLRLWFKVHMNTACDALKQSFRIMLVRQEPSTTLTFADLFYPQTRTMNSKFIPYTQRDKSKLFKKLWMKDFTFSPERLLGVTCNPDADDVVALDSPLEKWYRVDVPFFKRIRYAANSSAESDGWSHMVYIYQMNLNYTNTAGINSNKLYVTFQRIELDYTDV